MFNNVRFLKLNAPWPDSEQNLHEALARASFKPCGPLTERTSGWEAPVDDLRIEETSRRLCRSVAGADLLQLRTQSRLLPAAAINEALELRIEEYRERMGDLPGRREKRRMKLETRDNLMTKALLRSERTRAFFLRSEGVLAIDAASPPKIERFLDTLRAGIGRFDVEDFDYQRPVAGLLNRIFLGDPPRGVKMGRECRMQDPADSKAHVRFADMDLTDANIRKHVRDGMKLTHLGIEFNNVMSCVIDENGSLGKLRLLGTEAPDTGNNDDPLAEFDAEFVLLTGTLRQFIAMLNKALNA
jgi:recombination associated protein RdgC